MNLLYLVLFIVVVKNTLETRANLRMQFNIIRNNEVRQLFDALRLKLSMMNKFFVVACCYFLYELIVNGLLPTFEPDQDSFDPYANVV